MARRKLYSKATRVRLTDEEHRYLSELATKAGLSISRYLVNSALTERLMTSRESEDTEALILQRDWAINEVARVGNNINQIARQLNSQKGSISAERIEQGLTAVAGALNDLRRLLSEEGSQ